ncbi:MAG: M20/M25/M40 family metallo-hydrolase [Chitinophagaceae bacterium]|nr:M20/M25/M40 family metallo-hydrolase [Chitinophagaceae bacterium]
MRTYITIALSALTLVGNAQKLKKADKPIFTNLQTHISFLASDELEGRRAGTEGEKKAQEYIVKQFEAIGLSPKGNDGFRQEFDINDGKQIGAATFLIINGNELKVNQDFYPLTFSANGSTEAAVSATLPEKGVPWFIDLKEFLEENKDNPHFDLSTELKNKAAKAAEKGATAFIVYNTGTIVDNLKFNPKDRPEMAPIPVLYITESGRKKVLSDPEATLDMKLKVAITDKIRKGANIVGYIDNGASSTVVIGAHFDHLGYGEDGNSMVRTGEKLIHNGADDNASGTAAMIELARYFKNKKETKQNYLFLAFSAEELGLNGSKYFADNPTIDLKSVNYMINMDMVGRLNDSTKVLTVGGFGTSPWWSQLFTKYSSDKKSYFTLKYDSSGTGPSDHTSFYRKDIPVLFFFTGLHSDYHRPSDDADKINYMGELQIVKFVSSIVDATPAYNRLVFTKTRETQTTTSARFSVSMGIMPDYTYAGTGVHVDGVTEGRPAQKAGIQKNDVILQLGDFPTNTVEAYMQALGKFKKGDKTTVKYKRGEAVASTEVQF